MRYNLIMQFKTGDIYPHVKEIEESINGFMNGCGFSEKIYWQSDAPLLRLEIDKILSSDEEGEIIKMANESLKDTKMICTRIERVQSEL